MRRKISLVAGARPNFMKIAPIIRALDNAREIFEYRLIHTGQHYDDAMNSVFFRELGIPEPHAFLGAGGGTYAEQTAKIMLGFEIECFTHRPDLVMVVGDVNSTQACAIVAKQQKIAVAHVEAGLRSGDRAMPEEINRIVTDAISDWFFVTEPEGVVNLLREGHAAERIHHVGHVMIDNLFYQKAKLVTDKALATDELKRRLKNYGVVTLHRPSNVDDRATLKALLDALRRVAIALPLVFPVHPRTSRKIASFGLDPGPDIHMLPPLSYMEFLNLWKDADVVLTDSGGLQEETTALGVPCLTLRDTTERPITVRQGSNVLVGSDPERILSEVAEIACGNRRKPVCPELWDGRAADRIVGILRTEI